MRLGKYQIPKPLSEVMGKEFDVTEMGPGYKRGMILKVYKANLREVVGEEAIKSLLRDLRDAALSKDPYDNPILYLNFKPGSPWIAELQHRRYMLMKKLNDRLESDFIREVRVQ